MFFLSMAVMNVNTSFSYFCYRCFMKSKLKQNRSIFSRSPLFQMMTPNESKEPSVKSWSLQYRGRGLERLPLVQPHWRVEWESLDVPISRRSLNLPPSPWRVSQPSRSARPGQGRDRGRGSPKGWSRTWVRTSRTTGTNVESSRRPNSSTNISTRSMLISPTANVSTVSNKYNLGKMQTNCRCFFVCFCFRKMLRLCELRIRFILIITVFGCKNQNVWLWGLNTSPEVPNTSVSITQISHLSKSLVLLVQ